MNPVLIYTDTNRINIEKNAFNKFPALFQSVYDAFQAINITVTIAEINNLIGWTIRHNGRPDFVQNFAIDKLLDAAAPYVLNGIPLNREKVREMLVIPDTSVIVQILKGSHACFVGDIKSVRIDLLSLADGVVSKVNDADMQIESEYAHYTKTDKSAMLATDLLAVCDVMNTFDADHANALKQADPTANGEYGFSMSNKPNALKIYDGQFVVNLDFIRKFERDQAA